MPKPKSAAVTSDIKKQAAAPVVDDNQPLSKDILAKVGSWTITPEEFNQRLTLLKEGLPNFDPNKPGAKEAVLNELIRQQLLVQDAEDSGIGKVKEISDAVEDFRRTMLVQELANRLTKGVASNEAEALKYYTDNKKDFIMPTQWKVREIVLADEATAKAVLVQILQGGNFAEIAKAQSKGKTAADGGALKPFVNKAPTEAMQAAIANLDAGGTSSVFKGADNNYYIVHVDEKKGGETKKFEEIKAELIAALTTRKQQQAVLEHINALADKIKVKVNQDLIGGSK